LYVIGERKLTGGKENAMNSAIFDPKLNDEPGRLAALRRYDVLDSAPEAPFDKVTGLIKTILDVPIALISLVDENRQWFKSCIGLDVAETGRDVSFCDYTIQSRAPLIIPDAARDPRFAENPLVLGPPNISSYAGVPLETPDGYNIGSLCVIDIVPREFAGKQIDILKRFAGIVVDELELRRLAQVDGLTGAVSRRAFLLEAEKAISVFIRHQRPSALVMLDVDHFKRVNDAHGHPAGDAVLRAIGGCLAGMARPNDVVGRLGGEEFAVLLNDTGLEEARVAAERYRAALEGLNIAHEPVLRVTASFGIAGLGADCVEPGAWLERADLRLYAAKRAGRNRCCHKDEVVLV
jgi:diguanylate cyclase (GGDEF)-like protein